MVWPWVEHAFLGVTLSVVAVASVTDLRWGRIPNRLILTGIVAVAGLYAVLTISAFTVTGLAPLPRAVWWSSVEAVGANAALAVVASMLLYLFGLWSAGDAKLAMVIGLAQPAWVQLGGPIPWAPFIVVLGNSLMVALLLVGAEGVLRGAPRLLAVAWAGWRARRWPVTWAQLRDLMWLGLTLAALAVSLSPLRQWAGGRLGEVLSGGTFFALLVLFVAYKPLSRIALTRAGPPAAAVIFLFSAGYTVAVQGAEGLLEVGRSVMICLVVMALRGALSVSSRSFDSREVAPEQLEEGMVLEEEFVARLEADERWREAFGPRVGELAGEKLDWNMVSNLREWKEHNAPEERIRVKASLPFAPALTLGVAVTMVWGRLVFERGAGG